MASLVNLPAVNAQMINIRRDVKDAFYRYKMPKIVSKIEGRGNGIKTVIHNATDVARALNRLPSYLTKYFAFELGTLCIINERDSRYIVNGAHDAEKLQDVLDGFIKKFVLCSACDNPETELCVQQLGDSPAKIIVRACKACGHRGPVDMQHKLVTFMEKHPPPSFSRQRKAAVAHERATAKVDSAIVQGITQTDGFAASADAAQLLTDAKKASKEKRKLAALYGRLEAFKKFLLEDGNSKDNESIMDWIRESRIAAHEAIIVVVQVLLAQGELFSVAFKQRLPLLQELLRGELAQRYFLGSLERLVTKVKPGLQRQLPGILNLIYQASSNDGEEDEGDLIPDEVFLLWYSTPTTKFVKKEIGEQLRDAAKPFIKALEADEDAESEEELSEEEEDGEEN